MAWFMYNQNNSGGSFAYDKEAGITAYVIIEADNAAEADRRAEGIGLYWDGCHAGRDCPCCGDRWTPAWQDDGEPEPMIYGQPVAEAQGWRWMEAGYEIAVHPKDGPIQWYGMKEMS